MVFWLGPCGFYCVRDADLATSLLGGNKVSMLTHTYPHKSLRKIKVTICNHQADNSLYVRPNIWSGDLQVLKSMVIHDTECPYWDQVSLNNPNPLYVRPDVWSGELGIASLEKKYGHTWHRMSLLRLGVINQVSLNNTNPNPNISGASGKVWQCHICPYFFLNLQITRSDIRPHKVGCQPGGCCI